MYALDGHRHRRRHHGNSMRAEANRVHGAL